MKSNLLLLFMLTVGFAGYGQKKTQSIVNNPTFNNNNNPVINNNISINIPDWSEYVLNKQEFELYKNKYNDTIQQFNAELGNLKKLVEDLSKKTDITKKEKKELKLLETDRDKKEERLGKYRDADSLINLRMKLADSTGNFEREEAALKSLNCKSWLSFLGLKVNDEIGKAITLFGPDGVYGDYGDKYQYDLFNTIHYQTVKTLTYKFNGKEVLVITYEYNSRIIREILLKGLDGKAFIEARKKLIEDDKHLIIGIKRHRLTGIMNLSLYEGTYTVDSDGFFKYDCNGVDIALWAKEKYFFNISNIYVNWW